MAYEDKYFHYKGYTGKSMYSEEDKLFDGIVLGIFDVITFQSRSPKNIEKAFKDSVDDYLDFCKERGEKPEQPQ